MMEKKKEYINQLLSELKTLEKRILSAQNDEALPFSFFRQAFDSTQAISRHLHELQLFQVDEMKLQMAKLVQFLSESENRKSPENTAETPPVAEPRPTVEATEPEPEKPRANAYAEGIVLPEYKNPRTTDEKPQPAIIAEPREEELETETPVVRSFNDTVKAPPTVLDLKHGISLNDRFLFQRELFRNDRHEMNGTMLRLQAFDNYADAETYLKEKMAWDFENPTVKDFLQVIEKGFR